MALSTFRTSALLRSRMALNASLASLKAVCSTSKLLAPQLPNRELRRFLHSSSKYAATRLTEASNEPSLAHSASNQSETFGAIPDQDQIDASWSPRTYQVLDRAERDRRLFAQFSSRDDLPQLIRRLCRYGQIKEARTRLQNVPRTAEIDACWLSVIGACLQRAKYNGAFAIWTDVSTSHPKSLRADYHYSSEREQAYYPTPHTQPSSTTSIHLQLQK